jgi:hypothetical protein
LDKFSFNFYLLFEADEERDEAVGDGDRHNICRGGGINYIYGYEGSQAVPARPSDNSRFSEDKAFGSGEGKEMKSGARREVERGLTAFVHNF